MRPGLILACIGGYFFFLLAIAWYTSRRATNASYFLGNKVSPWYAVAFGLIGDSLSGVTFISVPGQVAAAKFSYMQIVFGYFVGYFVIGAVLLPLYYRLNLTSIYTFLRHRFGPYSQKTGAFYFLLSRTTGAAARLYLAAGVIQIFVLDAWGIPFWLTVASIIVLMLIYTVKGGIKTLVWTDTFQSTFLLLGVVLSIWAIARQLNLGAAGMVNAVFHGESSQVFFWSPHHPRFFWKEFVSGIFIAIVMTGLDQNMMQKNLSCRSLRDAQKNIYWFAGVMVLVNFCFVSLGALLFHYAGAKGIDIPKSTDHLFPLLALRHLGSFAAVVFIIGLTAATFSSADSVLTTLTTSFCIDFLGMEENPSWDERSKTRVRLVIHFLFAVVLLVVILLFKAINQQAVIAAVLKLAGYTYGPLLGLFAYGLLLRGRVNDRLTPAICTISPLACYFLDAFSPAWFDYTFGNELLLVNGAITFLGLLAIRSRGLAAEIGVA